MKGVRMLHGFASCNKSELESFRETSTTLIAAEGSKQWMHSTIFCQLTKNLKRKKAVEWPKIVKSSVSKKSSNARKLTETVFRKSTGNRRKIVEFVSIERTLIYCLSKFNSGIVFTGLSGATGYPQM